MQQLKQIRQSGIRFLLRQNVSISFLHCFKESWCYIWEDSPGIWGDIRILIDRPAWKSSLSVVPFSVFKDYFEDLLKSPVYFFVTLINFFGNLAMFIPIGFFPPFYSEMSH